MLVLIDHMMLMIMDKRVLLRGSQRVLLLLLVVPCEELIEKSRRVIHE